MLPALTCGVSSPGSPGKHSLFLGLTLIPAAFLCVLMPWYECALISVSGSFALLLQVFSPFHYRKAYIKHLQIVTPVFKLLLTETELRIAFLSLHFYFFSPSRFKLQFKCFYIVYPITDYYSCDFFHYLCFLTFKFELYVNYTEPHYISESLTIY